MTKIPACFVALCLVTFFTIEAGSANAQGATWFMKNDDPDVLGLFFLMSSGCKETFDESKFEQLVEDEFVRSWIKVENPASPGQLLLYVHINCMNIENVRTKEKTGVAYTYVVTFGRAVYGPPTTSAEGVLAMQVYNPALGHHTGWHNVLPTETSKAQAEYELSSFVSDVLARYLRVNLDL